MEKAEALKLALELEQAGELDRAYVVTEKLLAEDPADAQALVAAACVLKAANKAPIAYSLARHATVTRPDRPEPWSTFGLCAQELWRLDEALSAYQRALKQAVSAEQRALYLNNIASVYTDKGDYKQAEVFARRALSVDASHAKARHNLGLALLAQRKWVEGWRNYSASIGTSARLCVKYREPPNEEPTWDGTPDKTVVVYGEQGLGDEICAASMLPDVIKASKRVIVDCDKRLAGLFRRSFPQASVYGTRAAKEGEARWTEPAESIDASIAGFEVGQYVRKQDADFPSGAYLKACPVRFAMWKSLFASKGKPAIGLAWTGGQWKTGAKYRAATIEQLKPLLSSVDAHWVSLQYQDASADIVDTSIVQYPWATLSKDYDDTAALVAALDLVISVPTSVVHLAAGLGVRTIAMQALKPCWKFAGGLAFHPDVTLVENDGWEKAIERVIEECGAYA